ncbi:MAG: class IV adenylate cyclase [Gemmatimonadales bacterium]
MAGDELELKAVVPDVEQTRRSLLAAGASLDWRGLMMDRRFDRRGGELTARGEALRTRMYEPIGTPGATKRAELTWKGPAGRSPEGYKLRREIELRLADGSEAAEFLTALGYEVIHAVDRRIEQYSLGDAMVRLEWYPRMDVLVEVEGTPEGIERAIGAAGIERGAFVQDALIDFVARYNTGHSDRAAVSLSELGAGPPAWELL